MLAVTLAAQHMVQASHRSFHVRGHVGLFAAYGRRTCNEKIQTSRLHQKRAGTVVSPKTETADATHLDTVGLSDDVRVLALRRSALALGATRSVAVSEGA